MVSIRTVMKSSLVHLQPRCNRITRGEYVDIYPLSYLVDLHTYEDGSRIIFRNPIYHCVTEGTSVYLDDEVWDSRLDFSVVVTDGLNSFSSETIVHSVRGKRMEKTESQGIRTLSNSTFPIQQSGFLQILKTLSKNSQETTHRRYTVRNMIDDAYVCTVLGKDSRYRWWEGRN